MTSRTFFGNKKLSVNEAFRMVNARSVEDFFDNMKRRPTGYGFPDAWDSTTTEVFTMFQNTLKGAKGRDTLLLIPSPQKLRLTKRDPADSLFPLYTVFDFIGWIFSAANPVPNGATDADFYIPLAAIYAKFCRIIAAEFTRLSEAHKTQPTTITLGYFQLDAQGYVILGSTMGLASETKDEIQIRRKQVLLDQGIITEADKEVAPQKFGHCAETSFFIYVNGWLKSKGPITNIGGLALSIKEYEDKEKTKLASVITYNAPVIRQYTIGPCGNCELIMDKMKLDKNQFKSRKGATTATSPLEENEAA